jgi:hypothetical protein
MRDISAEIIGGVTPGAFRRSIAISMCDLSTFINRTGIYRLTWRIGETSLIVRYEPESTSVDGISENR